MKGSKSLSIFLVTLMAFSMVMASVPLVPGVTFYVPPGWPPIVVDGNISDWDAIQPLSVPGAGVLETTGDTEPWSTNASILTTGLSPQSKADALAAIPYNDKARDLKALYMWLQDSGNISIRLDVMGLYDGWYYGAGNASMYQMYFDTDDDHTTGASAGLNACDISAIGWEKMLYFDGSYGAVIDSSGSTLAYWNRGGASSGLWIAENITLGVFEFAIDRSATGMTGLDSSFVSVSVFSFKPGEPSGPSGNWLHTFDPDAPGTPGEGVGGGDLADEIPNGVTTPDHSAVVADKNLRMDMSENAKIHLIDVATGKENLEGDYGYLDTFTLAIAVEDFQDVGSYAMGLSWDPTILTCLGWTYNFSFFGPSSDMITVSGTINNTAGRIDPPYAATQTNATVGGISGDGWLAQVTFRVQTSTLGAKTWIALYVDGLVDYTNNKDITMPIKNAYFRLPTPEAVGPTASFAETPGPYYANITTISFTDTSVAGNNGTNIVPIVSWFWDFGDGNTSTLQNPTHMYILPGIYTVNLTVTDAVGRQAWKTATKNVIAKPLGDVIDAFTEIERAFGYLAGSTGEGLNQTADEYQVDENVTLFAVVTHNDWPLQERLVAWQVWNGKGDLVLVDTTKTNASGIANITFRIATICGNREAAWGKWKALAKTDIAKEPVNDTLWFSVGDYIDLLSVETAPSWKIGIPEGEHMNFTITLMNIAQLPRNATIVVVVYDDLGVPIGYVIYVTSVEGGEFCNPNVVVLHLDCISIPKWAYVGPNAKVRVSAYTALPSNCGVPWCESVETTFSIVVP